MKRLLSVNETADLLGLKVSTIYAWVHKKKIPYVKTGGKLKFIEDQISKLVEANSFVPDNLL